MSFNPSFEQAIISMETEAPRDFYNLDWTSISGFRFLSEYFIERFYFRLNWSVICNNQRLPEHLIRKFVNFVNFKVISNTQVNNLSLDFIYEFKDRLDMNVVISKKITEKTNNISSLYNFHKYSIDHTKMKTNIIDDTVITLATRKIYVMNDI